MQPLIQPTATPRASGSAPFSAGAMRVLAAATLAYAMFVAAGCGKKGPPLAPLLRVPGNISAWTVSRADDTVFLTLTVPLANVGGDRPADVARVEVYAVTAERPPALVNGRVPPALTLVSSAPVRRPLPPPPPATPDGPAVPTLPLAPGLDQGAVVTFRELLTAALIRVAPVTGAPTAPVVPASEPDTRLALSFPVVFAQSAAVRRHYVAVAVSRQGRRGAWSEWRSVPVAATSGPSSVPAITFDDKAIAISWTPARDARLSPAPAADGGLDSRPFGPALPATRYNIYAANAPADTYTVPGAVTRPVPLNEAPLAMPSFSLPGVIFGVERCVVVRGIDAFDGVDAEGPASPAACVTPRDTFAPPVPSALEAVAGAGVISLIWEAVDAPDLAGYLVLRGPATGEPATQLTPEPIGATSFEDRTVAAGLRYVYVVVAVDSATPVNRSAPSNRAEETARQ